MCLRAAGRWSWGAAASCCCYSTYPVPENQVAAVARKRTRPEWMRASSTLSWRQLTTAATHLNLLQVLPAPPPTPLLIFCNFDWARRTRSILRCCCVRPRRPSSCCCCFPQLVLHFQCRGLIIIMTTSCSFFQNQIFEHKEFCSHTFSQTQKLHKHCRVSWHKTNAKTKHMITRDARERKKERERERESKWDSDDRELHEKENRKAKSV
jgi:hypothetical protein